MSLEMQAHPPRNTQTHTHTHINVKIFASSLSGLELLIVLIEFNDIASKKKSTLDISSFKVRPLFFPPKGKVTACTGLYV